MVASNFNAGFGYRNCSSHETKDQYYYCSASLVDERQMNALFLGGVNNSTLECSGSISVIKAPEATMTNTMDYGSINGCFMNLID